MVVKRKLRQAAVWLARRELLVVLALAPWLLFPGLSRPLSVASLAALPLLWLVRVVAGRPLSVSTPLNAPLLFLLAGLGPAVVLAPRADLALPRATAFLFGLALYLALINAEPEWRRPVFGALGLAAAGAGFALLGLLGTNWVQGNMAFLDRVTGSLPSLAGQLPGAVQAGLPPSQVGGALALLLPATVSLIMVAWQRGRQPLMGHWRAWAWSGLAVALLMFLVLLLTQSRTALLMTLLVGGMALGTRWRGAGVVLLALLIAGGVLLGISLLTGRLDDWVVWLDSLGGLAEGIASGWQWRVEIWRGALETIRDYPLLGTGLHAFALVAWYNYGFDTLGLDYPLAHAHNVWLQAGADQGVVGLLAFAWLTVVVVLLGWALLRRRSGEERTVLAGIGLGLIAWLGHGLVNAITLGYRSAVPVWAMLGLLAAAWPSAAADAPATAGRRWVRLARGGLIILVLGVLVLWLQGSTLWALNRAANLLDRAMLSAGPVPGPEIIALLDAAGDRPGAVRRQAVVRYEMGDAGGAIRYLRQDEEAERFLVSRARLLVAQGSLEKADALVELGLEVLPESGRLTCLAGDIKQLQGNAAAALRFYGMTPERAESLAAFPEALAGCLYRQGIVERDLSLWQAAADSFAAAAELLPEQIPIQLELGRALFKATGEVSQAVAPLEAALAREPDQIEILLVLVDIYLEAGRLQSALEWSELAVTAEPDDPEAWLRLAQAHWGLDQRPEALQALGEALRLDPQNSQAAALQAEWAGG